MAAILRSAFFSLKIVRRKRGKVSGTKLELFAMEAISSELGKVSRIDFLNLVSLLMNSAAA